MTGLAAQSSVTPMALQTVAAMIVVAVLVVLGVVVVYSVVAGGLASLVLLVVALLRLLLTGARSAWSGARSHLSTRRITPEPLADLRVRPSG
jgi:hypothetical protein